MKRFGLSAWLISVFLIGAASWTYRPIRANDVWMHLASGRYIDQQKDVPRTDPFSFTQRGSPWIDHEWLYQWGLYRLYAKAGDDAIHWTKIVLILLTLVATIRTLRLYGFSPAWGITGAFLLFAIGRAGWAERADLISVTALGWLIFGLESLRTRSEFPNRILGTWPLLFAFWANLHGGYVIGLLVIGCYAVYDPRLWRWGILCGLATLLNPYGIQLPISIVRGILELKALDISEWQRTPWAHMQGFWILLVLCWASALTERLRNTPSSEGGRLLALGLLSVSAIQHVRNVPYFLLIAIPLLFSNSIHFYSRATSGFHRLYSVVLAGTLLVWGVLGATTARGGVASHHLPVAACQFIIDNRIPGPFYNDYVFGSYWIWRMPSEYPVFIDGRLHMVSGYVELNQTITSARVGDPARWQALMDRYQIQSALLKNIPAGMMPILRHYFPSQQWTLIYRDSTCMIMSRSNRSLPMVESRDKV